MGGVGVDVDAPNRFLMAVSGEATKLLKILLAGVKGLSGLAAADFTGEVEGLSSTVCDDGDVYTGSLAASCTCLRSAWADSSPVINAALADSDSSTSKESNSGVGASVW